MSIRVELQKVAEIRAMLGDSDPELVHDVLEGQTDIFEIIDWLLGRMEDERCFGEAIGDRIDTLMARKAASGARVERLRGALEACIVATGEKSVRRPDATVSLTAKKPSIASIDEAVLPGRFWKTSRSVSKSTINDALAAGETVPGVVMSNGGITLSIRRK